MPPIPQPPRPPVDGNALRYLQDLHQWLCQYVAGSTRGLPSQPAASASYPFMLRSACVAGEGWFVELVEPGYLMTANQDVQGTQHAPALADGEVTLPTSYLYLHAEFDDDELLIDDGVELVILAGDDADLTSDPFANAYLQLATIVQGGTIDAPTLTITPVVRSNVLHRKINTTHLWDYKS